MENTNWRGGPQGQSQSQSQNQQQQIDSSSSGLIQENGGGDWRTQLQPDSRQRIVNKIMETLKRHLPFSGQEGLLELKKIAVRFEEKIYTAATSQSDYLRKISLKMLSMESKSQPPLGNQLKPNPGSNNPNPADSVSGGIQTQVHNQGQQLPMPIMGNQTQARHQHLPQNLQNNMAPTGMQNSASLTTAPPSAGGMVPASLPNVNGQNSNLQSIQNIPNVAQNSMASSMGQGMASNMFANTQRQMSGRQQQAVSQQSQQQSQNPQHLLYQQQLQHQLNQKFPQGSISQSLVQPHMQQQQQQQQQQNLLQQSQHTLMQPTMIQSPPLSNLQQNQPSSTQQSTQTMLPQQSQPMRQQQQQQHVQQTSMIHQQTSLAQQPVLASQQQQQQQQQQRQPQQIIGHPSSGTNIQQNQMMNQPNSIHDMQQQPPQPQRMIGQQNNMSNIQQQQQQLLSQQGNISSMHQQQISKQNNISGIQQPQIIGLQSSNSGMPNNQQNVHMQQSRVTAQQPLQQSAGLISTQGQPSQQMQLPQQQLMSQIQSQPAQLQQQIGGLQQQANNLQRLQTSSALLHHQNVVDPQKQMFQPQRQIPDGPSTSLDSTAQTSSIHGGDWQEEAYQKIRSMKDMYYVELNELYQRIASKLELHDIPQQPKNAHLEKLKFFKAMLEKLLQFLRLNKNDIQIAHRDKIGPWEKQIVSILNSNRPGRPGSALPQGQIPQSRMHAMQGQNQLSQSQIQPHESQMNSQMQSTNAQGSVLPMQQNSLANLQHNSLPSASINTNPQPNMGNSLQSGSGLDATQGNAQGSLQQAPLGSIQQNHVSSSQQMNMNPLASQSGMNTMQSNLNPLQQNSNMIQHPQLKQEQQVLQSQQLKQLQQRQLQQQFLHRQQMLQQQQNQQQQAKQQQQQQQQQPAQLPLHNMSQIYQMHESNDIKMRQQMSGKPGILQQPHPASQRAYNHPQLKSGNSFMSSPSPQVTQHLSPQIDQQNMPTTVPKAGTPLQSSSSPFIVPSPSTPLVPSPMLADTEKVNPGVSPLSHTGAVGHQQATFPSAPAQSLAIGTPGISASPLLAEFTSPDGAHGFGDGKSTTLEQPHERLMRAMKSISSQALTAAVSDISSVVSMVDRVAGSAPGNGSRAAVGEDLAAMTKCRLQARDFFTQEGPPGSKKMRRYVSALPSNVVSSAGSVHDSFRPINCSEASDLESTATSCAKRPLVEANQALLEEMLEINRQLIDTTIEISNEDIDPSGAVSDVEGGEGTIVKCSYNAVALSPNLKALYASGQMAPIQPLRLLVPNNYPYCSPILIEKFPVEVSGEYEDLSMKAKSKFNISLRSLSQPMSLANIAQTWDVCARAVITEYAQQRGGGTFSSKYGTWENCLSAA